MRLSKRRLSLENLEGRRLLAAVDIPDDLSGTPAQVVVAPINIDAADGVRGVEIRLSYNTDQLDLTSAGVVAGSIWNGVADTQVTANVDDASGTAVIFVAASSPLAGGSGSIVDLSFTIRSGVADGTTSAIDLTEVTLNEGQIDVTPAPVDGSDPTDGLITVSVASGTDRLSGFVYADTNPNSLPDPQEGIPGVTITILNQATGAQRQTVTDTDGSYEFLDLAAGNYTVTEQQPTAYIEGGTNVTTIAVTAGSDSDDVNFRELGLRPEFVYGRLLTTLVRPVGSQRWIDTLVRINVDAANSATSSLATSSTLAVSSTPETASLSTASTTVSPSISNLAAARKFASAEPLEETSAAVMVQPSVATNALELPQRRDEFASESVDPVFAEATLF